MSFKKRHYTSLHILLFVLVLTAMAGCASIGRPGGGPKDVTPPEFVSSNPAPGALNFNKQHLDLYFNENVQLQDAFSKVIVSPVQITAPQISANGKHVSVNLRDTLLPNTTYTIDFGDAIKDLNEGNILDGFTTYFSTGDTIDTLRISGIVLEARTLEPAQGMLVGIYSNLADSAIRTLPLERVSRTNQYGQFTIHNVKPGDYKVFALNDINRDYKWDRTEDVAFYDSIVRPYVTPIQVTDTLRGYEGKDSLRTREGVAYFPNDVLLTWFNEDYKSQYLKDYERPERRRITINMGAKSDTLPEITIASGKNEGKSINDWALLNKNLTLDTLEYWIKDTTVLNTDSLYLSVKYLRTDSADMLTWKTDTLKFFFKDPKKKEKKKDKDKEAADTLPPPITFLSFSAVTGGQHDIYKPLSLKASQPIDTILPEGVRLEMKVDTIWEQIEGIEMEIDSLNPLTHRIIRMDWEEGETYRFTADSAAIVGIYNEWNNKMTHEFKVKTADEYSNLVFTITGTDSAVVVELLDKGDKVIAQAPVIDGQATFKYLNPGTVYARMYIDSNHNGKWDTGNVADSIQPEEVNYYNKKINLRKNWDITQEWNIYELAVDMQKPWDIKKNKPKLKEGERAPGQEDEEMEDEDSEGFGYGGYGTTSGYGSSNGYGRQTGNRTNNTQMGGFGGMRQR